MECDQKLHTTKHSAHENVWCCCVFQPITAPVLPANRMQPAERTAALEQAGGRTLVADARGFGHVKSVAWVRSRAGDELDWARDDNKDRPHAITRAGPPSRYAPSAADALVLAAAAASARPHPALLEFQQEQAQANERAQVAKNANVESRTSSSAYGAHYQQQLNGGGGGVNSIGVEQVLSQQARLWGSLDATSKRMGFGVSHAPAGSPLRALEDAQDQKRYKSVAASSFSPEGKDRRPDIRVPDSMNRTSCNFPLAPVNQYSAAMQPSSTRNPRAATAAAAAPSPSATAAAASAASSSSSSSPQSPLSSASAAMQAYEHSDTSTAHSLGYGSRHLFHRHYLSSAPQL